MTGPAEAAIEQPAREGAHPRGRATLATYVPLPRRLCVPLGDKCVVRGGRGITSDSQVPRQLTGRGQPVASRQPPVLHGVAHRAVDASGPVVAPVQGQMQFHGRNLA